MLFMLKIVISATFISLASWLSAKRPDLAGFIIALPIASLLALAFSHLEHRDAATSITFAKSILLAVPASYLFFVPFFLAERFSLGFWTCYGAGLALLAIGYALHQGIIKLIS